MNWLYYISNKPWQQANLTNSASAYLRPYYHDEESRLMVGKIIDFRMVALNFLFQTDDHPELRTEEIGKIYHHDLLEQRFHFTDIDIPAGEEDYFRYICECYTRASFDEKTLEEAMSIYLKEKGYPIGQLEKSDYDMFAPDINPVARMFSTEKMKESEELFGEEWWKHR